MTFAATVNAVWRTSMEVGVRVEAENPRRGESHRTATAYLTMVALDEDGRPTEVPPLATAADERRSGAVGRPSSGAATGSPSARRSARVGRASSGGGGAAQKPSGCRAL